MHLTIILYSVSKYYIPVFVYSLLKTRQTMYSKGIHSVDWPSINPWLTSWSTLDGHLDQYIWYMWSVRYLLSVDWEYCLRVLILLTFNRAVIQPTLWKEAWCIIDLRNHPLVIHLGMHLVYIDHLNINQVLVESINQGYWLTSNYRGL